MGQALGSAHSIDSHNSFTSRVIASGEDGSTWGSLKGILFNFGQDITLSLSRDSQIITASTLQMLINSDGHMTKPQAVLNLAAHSLERTTFSYQSNTDTQFLNVTWKHNLMGIDTK
ncbi:hypothetical protein EPI10_022926 [Gossypium australe]|uniref:F5/8 type C domain-containing protein n=1 Tax=Gossypium australe TaxID=47621 RepID=A0A5B6VT77_9ROSI|nr:hypothetical protein EPI10_022926 [Gossypium australe]